MQGSICESDAKGPVSYDELAELYFSKEWEQLRSARLYNKPSMRPDSDWIPAWVSERIELVTETTPRSRSEDQTYFDALRKARALLAGDQSLTSRNYELVARTNPDLPSLKPLKDRAKRRGWSWGEMVAVALYGRKDAGPLGDPELIPLKALAEHSAWSYHALGRAAREGRMQAVRRNGHWFGRLEWMAEYERTADPPRGRQRASA